MAEVTAALVKQLRDRTGAGMMDCKKALADTEGDLEQAIDWLRKKGLSQAQKKAGRTAAEGLVGIASEGTRGAVVEVNSETDFVARNETFQAFVGTVTDLALKTGGDIEALKQADFPGTGRTVEQELTQLIGTIGENMKLSRSRVLEVEKGVVSSYVHNQLVRGMGKIGVLVALEADAPADRLAELGKQLAMHVAAANPQAVSQEDIDPALIERERAILVDQARASGKPENIIEKMVEGRLRKFYEEVALLDQTFVIDGESRVRDVIERLGKELGTGVRVTGFARFQLGEHAASESGEDAQASATA